MIPFFSSFSISVFRCITIRYTAPTGQVFGRGSRLPAIAQKLLDLVKEFNLENNPIVIHVFSNAGGFVYQQITDLLHDNKDYAELRMVGTIFDSCPVQRYALTGAKAFMQTLKVNIVFRYILGCLMFLLLATLLVMNRIFCAVGSKYGKKEYWQSMKSDMARCPQLFLHSTADNLVPKVAVDEVMEARKARGIKVLSVCWDDSPHVGHLRYHRESYIQNCHDFLDLCLEREDK